MMTDPTNVTESFRAEVVRLTNRMSVLLEKHPAQAEVVRKLGEAARSSPESLGIIYRDGAVWGGAGSVADVFLEDKQANKEKSEIEVKLVECFERAGYVFERASQTAAIVRGWLKRGLLD